SIDEGQFEGARANGLTNSQTMIYSVLPQAYKKMIPPIISQLISLVKDTSLAMGIVLAEMTYRGQIIYAQNSTYIIPVLIAITLVYFLLNYGLSLIAKWFDRRLA
ncbi:MAG: ABC transporter permease subunit, partial [Leuconostoc mesenteroides]